MTRRTCRQTARVSRRRRLPPPTGPKPLPPHVSYSSPARPLCIAGQLTQLVHDMYQRHAPSDLLRALTLLAQEGTEDIEQELQALDLAGDAARLG